MVATFLRKCFKLILFLALVGTAVVSAQESPPQIVFLRLKLESNQVSMVEASVVPGTLKRISEAHAALELEVVTADGQVLWTNAVADPALRHLEFEDPAHPGEIISKDIQLTNSEFTVRVPVLRNAHQVNFFRSHQLAGTNEPAAKNVTTGVSSARRTSLGAVTLPVANK